MAHHAGQRYCLDGLILVLYLVREQNFSRSMLFGRIFSVSCLCRGAYAQSDPNSAAQYPQKRAESEADPCWSATASAAEAYIDRVLAEPFQWGYTVRGILAMTMCQGGNRPTKGIKVLGRIANLMAIILPENRLDEIAITLGLKQNTTSLAGDRRPSAKSQASIPSSSPITTISFPTKPYTEDLLGLPVINIRHVPPTNARLIRRGEAAVWISGVRSGGADPVLTGHGCWRLCSSS